MTKTTTIILAALLTACGPGYATLDYTDGETGDGDGDPTGTVVEDCDQDPSFECDQDSSCWSTSPLWSAWAQYADPVMIKAAVLAGVITETSDVIDVTGDCYDVVNSDSHVCVLIVDCIPLLTVPLSEILLDQADCAPNWPWTAAVDSLGQCWGILPDVAVRLDHR